MIIIAVFSVLIILALYLYFFLPVPSFSEEEIVKKIENGKVTIEWKRTMGVLDQNFSHIITIRNGQSVDTICESHNIADLKLNKYKGGSKNSLFSNFGLEKSQNSFYGHLKSLQYDNLYLKSGI